MFKRGFLFVFSFISAFSLLGQDKLTREIYIETYAEIAMNEMARTGIPASITLAQGCLESDNGNSRLARDANNHFGIKCHDWEGKKIYHDDDEKNECFRKYKTSEESFLDHSIFLTEKSRYAFLFDLKDDDYKAWARGLQKAGYATSKKYADLLISIIEANSLYDYDKLVLKGRFDVKETKRIQEEIVSHREIFTNNRVEYVKTGQGDTPDILRNELNLYPNEIYRYNDLKKGDALDSASIIYLQPKRRKAEKSNEYHVLEPGQSIWDVSQMYAVKLKSLYKMNNLKSGTNPPPGTTIWLRKKLPKTERIEDDLNDTNAPEESSDMKFKFDED
jgi:hypothetical protein